jgi:transcriptional regulator with XRE-family HTH domain
MELQPEMICRKTETMILSQKLQRLMEMRGIANVAEVARRAQVKRSSCYRWFEGTAYPDVQEGLRLAKTLGVSLDYLADDELDEVPRPAITEDERYLLRVIRDSGFPPDVIVKGIAGGLAATGARPTSTAFVVRVKPREDESAEEFNSSIDSIAALAPPRDTAMYPVAERDETELELRKIRERNRPKKVGPKKGPKGKGGAKQDGPEGKGGA